jgi:hypothetical protein
VSEGLDVDLRQPSPGRPLLPRYDAESELIVVERPVRLRSRHQVNVDDVLIFDVAENGLIVDFDLMIKMRLWRVREPWPPRPRATRRADLGFAAETIARKFFNATVIPWIVPETNQQRTAVRFVIHPEGPHTEPIELSERCIALVNEGRLVGFHLELPS